MRNIPCNTAWTRRQKRWPYWDAGSAPQQVNLPDDFVLEKPRTPTAPGEAAVGFIPDGLATYEKTFDAPKEWEGKPVFLSFDGAYMNARVTVNRELLQLHPYGYTPFAVELTPWLRFDIPNQLEVTLQGTQPSSRWYSGAGLYRQVSFWVGEPCYIDPGICSSPPPWWSGTAPKCWWRPRPKTPPPSPKRPCWRSPSPSRARRRPGPLCR